MTKKLFWTNPYQTTLETTITSVDGNLVGCEQTIFYALSGGQESDHGSINDLPVLSAQKSDKDIQYTLPEDHQLQVGDQITMTIDWKRRYRLMRLHFAAEVVLELVYKWFANSEKIGAHIAEDKARIDFLWADNISTLFPQLEKEIDRIVQSSQQIISEFSDESSQRRYWEVKEFARVPCGGTHLKTTAEVGKLKFKRKNIGKGKERIEIYLVEPDACYE